MQNVDPKLGTFLMGHSRPIFPLFTSLQQLRKIKEMFFLKIADCWIRTRVPWCRKRPLCQLFHNHCPGLETLNEFAP